MELADVSWNTPVETFWCGILLPVFHHAFKNLWSLNLQVLGSFIVLFCSHLKYYFCLSVLHQDFIWWSHSLLNLTFSFVSFNIIVLINDELVSLKYYRKMAFAFILASCCRYFKPTNKSLLSPKTSVATALLFWYRSN